MSEFVMEVDEGVTLAPERIAMLGDPGVGKTTWAAGAPRPFFLDLEGGSRRLPYIRRNKTPIKTHAELLLALDWLRNAKHDPPIGTVVIDTADLMEGMIHRELCARDKVNSIEYVAKGFTRGYTLAQEMFKALMHQLEEISYHRDAHIILLAHVKLEKIPNPSGSDYQRHTFKVHEKVSSSINESFDFIFYATRNIVVTDDLFDGKRARAIGGDQRIMHTTSAPSYIAKSRVTIPDPIPLSWHEFSCHLAASGFPRLLRETLAENARRLNDHKATSVVADALSGNVDVARLAAINAKLCAALAKLRPGNVSAVAETSKEGVVAAPDAAEEPTNRGN